jgi:cytochrome c-type biogenesis protein CcmF
LIHLIGEISLSLALVFSLMQSIPPLLGYYRRNPHLLAFARTSALGQCACVMAAYVLLTTAFLTNDFSMRYVAENSHPDLPLMYRLTAVWGAHEGSILLWILFLNGWTIIYSIIDNSVSRPLVISILGIINFFFLAFLLFTSNPFLLASGPLSGHDLNPLLQDPGFVIHPPMLYIGYVGFSVAFAITLAALLRGQLDTHWATLTRRFALAAWCCLTAGIALGSWWAYRVLGWGGFWFWDPVENASLLPWLSGTALIHVLALSEKRDTAQTWAALLALITFSLSLLGTFLVRSGVLVSAHTFANDPARGVFLLLLLAILMTSALAIYLIRLPHLTRRNVSFSRSSREMGLLLNSTLLIVAMLTILIGTLYPLILDALHLGTISVGAPYFNTVMAPIIFITLGVMGLAVLTRWQNQSLQELWQLSWKKLLASVFGAIGLLWLFTGQVEYYTVLSLALSLWVIFSVTKSLKILPGMSIAHLGFAICVIGIILSSVLNQEKEVRIRPGNAVKIGPYQFFFVDTKGISGSNYRGIRAEFDVLKGPYHVTNLYPEKRIYIVREMVMTKVAIHPGIFRDLYMALGEPLEQDFWSVRIYYKPFVRWIWLGAIIMIIGGIFAILRRIDIRKAI